MLNSILYNPILQFVLKFNISIAMIKYSHKRILSPSHFITHTRVQTGAECEAEKIAIWSCCNNLLDVYRCRIVFFWVNAKMRSNLNIVYLSPFTFTYEALFGVLFFSARYAISFKIQY